MNDTRIRDQFGFTPTEDFHLFWEFARSTNADVPQHAFNDTVMISLAGPFDMLAGRFDRENAHFDPCLHWRYFGDPPEFVTILLGGSDGLHWGYVVDRQVCPPLGVAGFYAHDDVSLFQESSSLFVMLWNLAESVIADTEEDVKFHPESTDDDGTKEHITMCRQLLDSIDSFCSKHDLEVLESDDLTLVEHCNPPSPFPFPEPKDFDKLSALIATGIEQLTADGYSDLDARLKIGRMLWHWHHDGNALIEESAFGLLDAAYEAQHNEFLRHVLYEHRNHRHRDSLDVFDC